MMLIFFIKELGKRFNKNGISVIAENRGKCISVNVKINVNSAGVKHKDGTKVCKIFVKKPRKTGKKSM